MHRRQEVQLDRLLPRVGRLVLERRRGRTARVAKQDVEPAELLGDALHQSGGLLRDRHIGWEWRIPATIDRHPRAFCFEHLGDCVTDAARAAAHERDATLEPQVHRLKPTSAFTASILIAHTFNSAIFA